jgi:hypothetical protein
MHPYARAYPILLAFLAGNARAAEASHHYVGYVLALPVCELTMAATIQPDTYSLALSFRLTGAPSLLYHAQGQSVVTGQFDGARAVPQALTSTGRYGGVPHITRIVWHDGTPTTKEMTPPMEKDHALVPQAMQVKTVDTLSTVAALIHQVDVTGKCDATSRIYDGVRLSELVSRTGGVDNLPISDRSSFHGPAQRCDLTARMLGGFMRDDDTPAARRPKHATVWLARLAPDQPPLPVRIAFYPEAAPGATLYLK